MSKLRAVFFAIADALAIVRVGRLVAITWPLVGAGLVGYGSYSIYPPAGFIVVGALMILDTLHSRGHAK